MREHGNIDFAQDYSGQSYVLALHLDALPVSRSRFFAWTRYLDIVGGFETRHYPTGDFPTPPTGTPRQTLYLGVTFNMQRILADVFCDSPGRRIAHGIFEHIGIPYTTLRLVDGSRSPP